MGLYASNKEEYLVPDEKRDQYPKFFALTSGVAWEDGTVYIMYPSGDHAVGYNAKMQKIWEESNYPTRWQGIDAHRCQVSPLYVATLLLKINTERK